MLWMGRCLFLAHLAVVTFSEAVRKENVTLDAQYPFYDTTQINRYAFFLMLGPLYDYQTLILDYQPSL
jgi:hypothetical protein